MSLAGAREKGAKVRIVYSGGWIVRQGSSGRQVVFLAVGFETTTPASCLAVRKASEDGLTNFALLVVTRRCRVLVYSTERQRGCFPLSGHVNAITGTELCESLVDEGVSGVVAGL